MTDAAALTPPAEGESIAIAPGILWARMALPFKPDHVNIYALADDDGWTLVDCGPDLPASRAAWDALRAGPLAGRPIARLLITHHHIDHIGLAGHILAQEDGCALMISRTAYLMARMLTLDVQDRPLPETLAFWRRAGMSPDRIATRAAARPFNQSDAAQPLPLGFRRLAEGQHLTLGGRDWTVRMGEGHAPEHATLWSDDVVIGGDQLLARISPNLGVYATEPQADPVGAWLESCARLATYAQDGHLTLPGHGVPFRGLPARLIALIENHEAALNRLEDALRTAPRTAADCFDVLYRRRIAESEYGLALVEAVGHVNHLAATGRIRPAGLTGDGGQLWRATSGGA